MAKIGWLRVALVIYSFVAALISLFMLIPSSDYLIKLDNTNLKPSELYYHELRIHDIQTSVTDLTLQETTLPQYFYVYTWGYESHYTNGTTITVHKSKHHDISRMYKAESKALRLRNGSKLLFPDPKDTWLSFPTTKDCVGSYYCKNEYVTGHRLQPALGKRTRILKANCAMSILLFFCCVAGARIDSSKYEGQEDLEAAYTFAGIFWVITVGLAFPLADMGRSRISELVSAYSDSYEAYGIFAKAGPYFFSSSTQAQVQEFSTGLLVCSFFAAFIMWLTHELMNS